MSAAEIKAELENIRTLRKENLIELLKEMIDDPEMVEQDEQFVFTSHLNNTKGLDRIEKCIQNIQANEWGSFTGYISGGTVPFSYHLEFEPNGSVSLMTYNDHLGLKEYIITDIYEHKLFYHFTDGQELLFSIPKVIYTFEAKTPVSGYIAGEDLGADASTPDPLTAQQAAAMAAETEAAMNALAARRINVYGAVIPEDITAEASEISTKVMDAVQIHQTRFYKVGVFQQQEDLSLPDTLASSVYYISVKGDIIFLESMVAGELIPIGYKDIQHFQISQ